MNLSPVYRFELPLPPTANHRLIPAKVGNRIRLITGPRMRAWKDEAARALGTPETTFGVELVRLEVALKWPDRRRRDLDGPVKPLLDCLTAAGVWEDDSQVRSMVVEALPVDYGLQVPGTMVGQVSAWVPF